MEGPRAGGEDDLRTLFSRLVSAELALTFQTKWNGMLDDLAPFARRCESLLFSQPEIDEMIGIRRSVLEHYLWKEMLQQVFRRRSRC